MCLVPISRVAVEHTVHDLCESEAGHCNADLKLKQRLNMGSLQYNYIL